MNDFSSLGLSVSTSPQVMHIQSETPLTVLSSAVIGGGYRRVRHILNMHVDKNYSGRNPDSDLRSIARQLGIHDSFTGLMTAVYFHNARGVILEEDGIIVGVLITAGIGNAACAGITLPFSPSPGTINILAFLNRRLSRTAMVNAA